MVLTPEDEEKILRLHQKGMVQREIARLCKKSLTDVSKVLKKHKGKSGNGNEETSPASSSEKGLKSTPILGDYSEMEHVAYRLFEQNKQPHEVVIELEIPGQVVQAFYEQYLRLKRLGNLVTLHREVDNDGVKYMKSLYERMKADFTPEEAWQVIQDAERLPALRREVQELEAELERKQGKKRELEQEIGTLEQSIQNKIKEMEETDADVVALSREVEERKQELLKLNVKNKLAEEKLEKTNKRFEDKKRELDEKTRALEIVEAKKLSVDSYLASIGVKKGSPEYNHYAKQYLMRLDYELDAIFPLLVDAVFRAIQMDLDKAKILSMLSNDPSNNPEKDPFWLFATKNVARLTFILRLRGFKNSKLKSLEGQGKNST